MNRQPSLDECERLEEIRTEIAALVDEAEGLVERTSQERIAGAYWIPHLREALGNQGRAMCSMKDTVEALLGAGDPDLVRGFESDPDCFACLKGHGHSLGEHERALRRARES